MKSVQIQNALYEEVKRITKEYPAFYRDVNEFMNVAVIHEVERVRQMEPGWTSVRGKR